MAKYDNDLTEGSVARQLIKFSIPFLISNILQAFYSVADMFIVSQFSGKVGISGVNLGSQLTMLVTNIVVGFTVGGTVLVAQYFGAKRMKDIEETIGTLFFALFVAAALMTGLVIAFSEPLLRLIQTPPEAFAEAKAYLNICMLGTVFIFFYNAVSSILRGMGDSRRPMYYVAVACVVNIGLDYLFVGAFRMSAAGAALATVIAQALSLALAVFHLSKSGFIFKIKLKSFRPRGDKLRRIVKIGLPTSLQNVISSISFLVMTTISNSFGIDASAAVGIVGKFNGFAILPAVAMSASVSAMAGQNLGANKPERAMKTMWTAVGVSLGISVLIFAFVQIFPEAVIKIFDSDESVVLNGVKYLRAFSFDYLFVSFFFCFNGLIIGAGKTVFALINGALCAVVLRIPVAYLMAVKLGLGMTGVGMAAPAATLGAIALTAVFIFTGQYKKGGLLEAEAAQGSAL